MSSVPAKLRQYLPPFMNPNDDAVNTILLAKAAVLEDAESSLDDVRDILSILGATDGDLDVIAAIYGLNRLVNESDDHLLSRISLRLQQGGISPVGISNQLAAISEQATIYEPSGRSFVSWDPRTDFRFDRSVVTATWTRASTSMDSSFNVIPANTPIWTSVGNMSWPAVYDGTTNITNNSDFETVTGTAQVFSDPLTGYTGSSAAPWTVQSGSFTFGTGGATSGTPSSFITTGNFAWKPLVGSGSQNLALTKQATFVEPSTLPAYNGGALYLYTDSNDQYFAYIDTHSTVFSIYKLVGGTETLIVSVANTWTPSTTYTITISLDHTGLLTAKLYSGTGTGGTLLQTLTATDTSLSGGFLVGVGGDTGVIVSGVSVTAPWADSWTIGGDTRVAWALTTTAISGTYSANAICPLNGIDGYCSASSTVTASTVYTASGYIETSNMDSTAYAFVRSYDGTNTHDSIDVQGTATATRRSVSYTSASGATTASVEFVIQNAGTVTFDAAQLEQKAVETLYYRNDSTTVSATRDTDAFTLPATSLFGSQSQGVVSIAFVSDDYGFVNTSDGLYITQYLFDWNAQVSVWFDGHEWHVVFGSDEIVGTFQFDAGQHIAAISWDSDSAQLTIDGIAVASGTITAPTSFSGTVYIGTDHSGANACNAFVGNIMFGEAWWSSDKTKSLNAYLATPVYAQTLFSGAFFSESLAGVQGAMIDGAANYVGVYVPNSSSSGVYLDSSYLDSSYLNNAQAAQSEIARSVIFPLFPAGKKLFLYTPGQQT